MYVERLPKASVCKWDGKSDKSASNNVFDSFSSEAQALLDQHESVKVSGFKLALRSEIVSWPLENILLTATAEPSEGGWHHQNIKFLKKNHEWWLTGHWKQVVGKPREIWKLGLMTSPPYQRIAGIKILLRKLEVIQKLVTHRPWPLLVTGCEVNLLRGGRRSWCWHDSRLGWHKGRNILHVLLLIVPWELTLNKFELGYKQWISCTVS